MKEERIQINKTEDELSISIKAYCDDKKQKMLFAWIILFTICGIIIISQFFGPYEPSVKVFF